MPSPRVIIFSGTHGAGSGAERVLEYLLAGAAAQGERFCIIAPTGTGVSDAARDFGHAWLPWQSDRNSLTENLRAYFRFIGKHRGKPPGDLVHAWHTRGFEWALALGRQWEIPCAGTLHDDPSHLQFGMLRKWIIHTAASRLNSVAAVSDALAKRCGELGWNREFEVIHNGLPDAPASSITTESPIRIGFLASNSLWKGTALLPELLSLTSDLPLEWHLYGERRSETDAIIADLLENPLVRHHGRRSVAEIFSQIDLLLHLSIDFDPYPTVLLEAARAGIPAIASNVGGVSEIIDDGCTGLLFPPGNAASCAAAIRQLVQDRSFMLNIAAAARARFEQHLGIEQMVAEYLMFWNRLRSIRQ
jgi:glycosyltransferase involved in cell wall biosynthesis